MCPKPLFPLSLPTPDLTGTVAYCYDGTFEGLLTVVFEAYDRKRWPVQIITEARGQPELFSETLRVGTDAAKANRVWRGVLRKISALARTNLYRCFLSELSGVEMVLFGYLRLAFDSPGNIEDNFASEYVRQVDRISRQVAQEKHRMDAFVRFQKTADDLYFSSVSPDFNVLPLISEHFRQRYADQHWLIYDTRRRYGIYYDLQEVRYVSFEEKETGASDLAPDQLDGDEACYQALWQAYYDHVNIPARKNPKLQLRQLPRRYWKFLPEMRPR